MLRRLAPRVSAFAPRVSAFAAQRARGMCDAVEIDMVCRVFSCKVRRSQCTTPESDSTVPLQATGPPGHPPTHPATHGVWQVKDDSAAHQMDMVFDSLLDKAAEAEGCAGASPVETRPKRRIGRGRPVPGASRGWCGSERRLQSTSWPQADPASDPACSRPGAARLVCKSEWDYKVITNADPTLNPSPNA